MTANSSPQMEWEKASLGALAYVSVETMPAFESQFLDDIATYLMGSGPLEPPYTDERGGPIISPLLEAMVNSAEYVPENSPALTPEISTARAAVVQGAHDLAAVGTGGLTQLICRLMPAVKGQLENNKGSPEQQTYWIFYYGMLALASGQSSIQEESVAAGVMDIFQAWN